MTSKDELKLIFSQKLKKLLQDKELSQVELSKILQVDESTVGKWLLQKSLPRISILDKLSAYFQMPRSYFLEKEPIDNNFSAKDERDIKRKLDEAIASLDSKEALMFDGEPLEMDDDTKDLLRASLENSIRLAKTLAKKKYTPKKYRKNSDN